MVTDKNAGALVVEEGVQYWCSLNLSSLTAEKLAALQPSCLVFCMEQWYFIASPVSPN